MEKQPAITIQNQVYQRLKEEIRAGAFAPGQKLQEQTLATAYEVSRSPVREALRRLGSEGLVEEIPNRGVFVKTFTRKDMADIFEVRVMLESRAIERMTPQAIEKVKDSYQDLLEKLRAAYDAGDLPLYTQLDTQLHTLFVTSCGNRLIADLYERISCQISQFRLHSLLSRDRFEKSIQEHESIIRLLLEGNTASAREENYRHLLLARDQILGLPNQEG